MPAQPFAGEYDRDAVVEIPGRRFVFTGLFPDKARPRLERAVVAAGGILQSNVSGMTDYLVVGVEPPPTSGGVPSSRKIREANWERENRGLPFFVSAEQVDAGLVLAGQV